MSGVLKLPVDRSRVVQVTEVGSESFGANLDRHGELVIAKARR